jgi:hypothetical protein
LKENQAWRKSAKHVSLFAHYRQSEFQNPLSLLADSLWQKPGLQGLNLRQNPDYCELVHHVSKVFPEINFDASFGYSP